LTILVAEDSPLLAMWLEENLFAAGYAVVGPASTYARAVELAERQPPDVAFVNPGLRGLSNGVSLARHLRDRFRTVVFFLKASQQQAASYGYSVAGYIAKPFNRDAIMASIELAYRIRRGEAVVSQVPGVELFVRTGAVVRLPCNHLRTRARPKVTGPSSPAVVFLNPQSREKERDNIDA
jgi:DNA-binding response OmpR family regulator